MLESVTWASDLAAIVDAHADRPCTADAAGELSFAGVAGYGAALALHLREAGIAPGTPVALCLRNGVASLWASLGARLAGLAETPLNPAFTAAERSYCLSLAGIRQVVTTREEAPFFAGIGASVTLIEEIAPAPPGALATLPPVPGASWGRVSFTSGTTGRPKAIVHTHAARWLANLLQRATFAVTPGPASRILLMTPMSHGAGLLAQAFLDQGAASVIHDGVHPDAVASLLDSGAVDHVFAPPTVLAKLAAAFPDRHFPGIRIVFTGTAPLTPPLYEKARALFGPVIRVTYGKFEIVNPIAVLPPASCDEHFRALAPGPGACVGWPAAGVEVAIRGEDGADLAPGTVGEVHLRAQHMLAGHIDSAGFQALPAGAWHATGDLGRFDVRGRLHLVGRTADVIKSGGYKINPEEIETALAGTAAGVAVTTLPSEYWGEVIVAAAEGTDAEWPARAGAAVAALARFKHPRAYIVVDTLPRNAQGKVPRGRLRALLEERYRLADGPHPALVAR